jgi:hypothetical protein
MKAKAIWGMNLHLYVWDDIELNTNLFFDFQNIAFSLVFE